MRGDSKAALDSDIILKDYKDEDDDFTQNYVYTYKNRYQERGLDELKYSIFENFLIKNKTLNEIEYLF